MSSRVRRLAAAAGLLAAATAGASSGRLDGGSDSGTITRPAAGFILLDRHLEKNAGSTFRELLLSNERKGNCVYWGYQQRSPVWSDFVALMRNLSAADVPPRICIEAHTHIDYGTPWLQRLAQLEEMRADLRQRALDVRVLLVVRLREPLSHYISYYLWTVAERQLRNPAKYGRDFESWVRSVPNLQSELLLSSKAAFTASYAGLAHQEVEEWGRRWARPGLAAERRAAVLRAVASFDILGTNDRFDETALLIARAVGWRAADAAQGLASVPPSEMCNGLPPRTALAAAARQKGQMWFCRDSSKPYKEERARVQAHVCPNRSACEALVRAVAPLDHELYARANARLDAAVASGGAELAEQLRELLKAKRKSRGGGRLSARTVTNVFHGCVGATTPGS